jgi:hypothetical protein
MIDTTAPTVLWVNPLKEDGLVQKNNSTLINDTGSGLRAMTFEWELDFI